MPPPRCNGPPNSVELKCEPGTGVITRIEFAAFGAVGGSCAGGFKAACHSNATRAIVEAHCVGKTECSIDASVAVAGGGVDPCPGQAKVLAVVAAGCTPTLPDNGTAKSPGGYAGSTQTGNAMALYLDVPPTDAIRAETVASLVAAYRRANDHPKFGTVGARVFLPVLADNGEMGLAIDFATKTTQPSYGFMVEQGPGTIWEEWGGDAHHAAGSKNHPMFCGGVGVFLWRLAGLAAAAPAATSEPQTQGDPPLVPTTVHTQGGPSLVLDAVAIERIQAASGLTRTRHGDFRWDWELRSGWHADIGAAQAPFKQLHVRVDVPHGVDGVVVCVPAMDWATSLTELGAGAISSPTRVWAKGTHASAAEEPAQGGHWEVAGAPGTLLSVKVPPGQYHFVMA